MHRALGSTSNPRDLIPGEPEALTRDLRSTAKDAKVIHKLGHGLGNVKVKEWIGEASEAFHAALGEEPSHWVETVERIIKGGDALATYAEALANGQDEAQRAIELFTQAQAASRLAAARYTVQANNAAAAGVPNTEFPPFTDPGAAALKEAEAILAAARKGVSAAADTAWGAFDDFLDSKEKKELATGEKSFENKRTGKVQRGYQGGLKEGPKLFDGEDTTIAEGQAKVDLLNGKLDGSFQSGPLSGKGALEGSLFGAGAGGSITAGPAGLTAGGNAEAYVGKGSADGELHLGPETVKGHADGMVGVQAEARAHVGPTGAEVEAGAFAGAKVHGDVTESVAGFTAGMTGEAWAGAGATANFKLGMGEDGKFHIGGSAGVALGYGGKIGYEVSFDPKELKNTVHQVADSVGRMTDVVGHGLGI